MKEITIKIPLFVLWEEARHSAFTSDDWSEAYRALEEELRREISEDGSTRVYEMIGNCLLGLREKGKIRPMTDEEIQKDEPCKFYYNERT